MFKLLLGIALVFALFACPAQAVDRTLSPVADGMITYSGIGNSTTGSTLLTEWGEGQSQYYTGRRILLKFDVSSYTTLAMRDAKLYLYGGTSKSNAQVNAYHYSDDTFTEASMTYPYDMRCRYLTNRVITNRWQGPGFAGVWYQFDIGDGLYGWDYDGYLSLCLRNATNITANSASFVSRNSVTWNGTKGFEPFIVFSTWGALQITDPGFREGLGSWSVDAGNGTAVTVTNPYLDDDNLLSMTTGSPVTVSQILDTPYEPFYLIFDYEHQTTTGELQVTLTDRDGHTLNLAELAAPDTLPEPGMRQAFARIDDPSWLGLDHVTVSFTYDGETDSTIWIDNVYFTDAVPEPATLSLILALAITRPRPN
ncbi:DNRLRE domain-containing protein [Mucisphaera calidilacus]|nr:DNRLRE domain-containing protein [Mucisphaera calidilacus]